MKAQSLKNAILQLAVQGKLVAQNPQDEPASELLKKIKAEKMKLIKEKKIKADKPFTPITDEEKPFDIPASWEWVRLGEIISLISGQDMEPSKYNDTNDGVPYLTGASNIDNGEVIINRWTSYPKAIAYKFDLLLTCKGTVGTTAILHEEKVHIARQIMSIRNLSCVDVLFLKLYMDSFVSVLKSKAKSMIP